MRAAGRNALGIHADLTRQEDVDGLFAETLQRFGRLDVLVNNAGRSMRGGAIDTTPEQFRELDGVELHRLGALHAGGRSAPAPAARPPGQYRLAGGQVGGPMGGGLSGHEVRRGGLLAAIAAGTGAARAARPLGLPRPDPPQAPRGSIRWKGWQHVPERARGPGAGIHMSAIPPERLAAATLRACRRRQPELIIPTRAKWLFAVSQLWPRLGDWIVRRASG